MSISSMEPLKVFYCYARRDQDLRAALERHLSNLKRLYHLKTWFDRQINPGENWEEAIDEHLNTADFILLLISPDFMASDYCYNREMQRAMARHAKGEAKIIPILLRPVHWKNAPFSSIQMLPTDALPVTRWSDLDEAFYNIVLGIELVIEQLLEARQTKLTQVSSPSMLIQQIQHVSSPSCASAVLEYIKQHRLDTDPNLIPTKRNVARHLRKLSKEQITEAITDLMNTGRITEQRRGKATVYALVTYEAAVLAYIENHWLDTDPNLIPTERNVARHLRKLSKEQITEAIADLMSTGQITEQKKGRTTVYILPSTSLHVEQQEQAILQTCGNIEQAQMGPELPSVAKVMQALQGHYAIQDIVNTLEWLEQQGEIQLLRAFADPELYSHHAETWSFRLTPQGKRALLR